MSNHTHVRSSQKDGLKQQFTETLQKYNGKKLNKSTSLSEDSRAKILANSTQKEKVYKEKRVVFGDFINERLGKYDQNTHSLKTFQHSLTTDSPKSLQTLPRSGMMRNGVLYPLKPLALPIREKEFSYLPTPTESDHKNHPKNWKNKKLENFSFNLSHEVGMRYELAFGKESPHLNPGFVEWMMGFPIGWSDLTVSGMPLSRKWRNTLPEESKKN